MRRRLCKDPRLTLSRFSQPRLALWWRRSMGLLAAGRNPTDWRRIRNSGDSPEGFQDAWTWRGVDTACHTAWPDLVELDSRTDAPSSREAAYASGDDENRVAGEYTRHHYDPRHRQS